MFVGAPNGEEEKVKERFLEEGISLSQLTVRIAKETKSFVKLTSFSRYSAQVFRVRRHLWNDALKIETISVDVQQCIRYFFYMVRKIVS